MKSKIFPKGMEFDYVPWMYRRRSASHLCSSLTLSAASNWFFFFSSNGVRFGYVRHMNVGLSPQPADSPSPIPFSPSPILSTQHFWSESMHSFESTPSNFMSLKWFVNDFSAISSSLGTVRMICGEISKFVSGKQLEKHTRHTYQIVVFAVIITWEPSAIGLSLIRRRFLFIVVAVTAAFIYFRSNRCVELLLWTTRRSWRIVVVRSILFLDQSRQQWTIRFNPGLQPNENRLKHWHTGESHPGRTLIISSPNISATDTCGFIFGEAFSIFWHNILYFFCSLSNCALKFFVSKLLRRNSILICSSFSATRSSR